MTTSKELKAWEKEKKLIPVMIKQYCHGKHGTRGEELCEECRALTEYALGVQGAHRIRALPP